MSQEVFNLLFASLVIHLSIFAGFCAAFTIAYYIDGEPFKVRHLVVYFFWPILVPFLFLNAIVKSGW